jgi:MFS family permease
VTPAPEREAATGTWAAMSVPAYRLLFYSAAIVIFGVMGQAVARGWLARELTGSNAGLGGVMLVFGAAMLVTTPLGGVAADRYSKRFVLLLSVLALTASSLAIGVAVVTDVIAYWMLLVAGGVQAAAFAFYLPARISLISEVVPAALLQNAVVLAQMSQEGMRVFAPALAGVLIGVAWFGVGGVFIAAGLTSAAAALFVAALPRPPRRVNGTRSPFGELVDAVRYVRANREVGLIALVTVGVVMIGFPYLAFLPTLADDRFEVGAVGYGVMSAIAGLGALGAGLVNASWSRGTRPWRTIAGSGGAFGVALVALGMAGSYPLALVALAAIGASGLMFQTSTQALLLRISPLEYHGRLQSMVILGFSGFGLMALPLGVLADAVTLRVTLAGMGVAVLTTMVLFALARRQHRRDATAAEIG